MKKIGRTIAIASTVLLIYSLSPWLGFTFPLVFSLFLALNALTLWMVVRILKLGQPSGKSFDDAWYEEDHF